MNGRLEVMREASLRRTIRLMEEISALAADGTSDFAVDLSEVSYLDMPSCVMLHAEIERAQEVQGAKILLLPPKARGARMALEALQVAGITTKLVGNPEIQRQVAQIASGAKGDASPSESVFEVAQLAEQIVDPVLADRIHGALNEAADNVISWAYGRAEQEPAQPGERWWAAGVVIPGEWARFIAYDRGLGIPAVAPQTLGDSFQAAVHALLRRDGRTSGKLLDTDILQLTIRNRRSGSGKEERGKGLANMINVIDQLETGVIRIFSGEATYSYARSQGSGVARESGDELGVRFPGTMIIWQVGVPQEPGAGA